MTRHMEVTRSGPAPIARVWALMAEPACWPAWGPHLRHVVDGAGGAAGTIAPGDRLQVRLPGPIPPLPLHISEVDPLRSWTMRAGPVPLLGTVTSVHELASDGATGGATDEVDDEVDEARRAGRGAGTDDVAPLTTVTVRLTTDGDGPAVEAALRAYRPVAWLAIGRLLGIASAEADGEAMGRLRMCQR